MQLDKKSCQAAKSRDLFSMNGWLDVVSAVDASGDSCLEIGAAFRSGAVTQECDNCRQFTALAFLIGYIPHVLKRGMPFAVGLSEASLNSYSQRTIGKVMKKCATTIIFVLTALLARPQAVLAQAAPAPIRGSWGGLKAIPSGDELAVELRNGQTVKGRLRGVSDTSLTLDQGKKTTDVSRGDALRVHRVISKSAKRATLIGLGIGAGVGMTGSVVAAKSGPGEGDADLWAPIAGTIGAGVGALVGYIVGSRKQRALIYETR